ncbi:hypothetical protein ABIF20_004151 [Bradyrhizobium japonicum]
MTRLTLVSAALIAAAVYQTQAAAARDVAPRRAPAQAAAGLRESPGTGRVCLCALQATALHAEGSELTRKARLGWQRPPARPRVAGLAIAVPW